MPISTPQITFDLRGRRAALKGLATLLMVLAWLAVSTTQTMGAAMDMGAPADETCTVQVCCAACVTPELSEPPQVLYFRSSGILILSPSFAATEKHPEAAYHPPR